MKREEQIKEAARQRANQYDHPSKWSDTYYGFIDGAQWADSHPNWISVEEELPKEGQVVLIYSKGGDVCVTCYKNGAFNCSPLFQAINVTHWMEIQPPRKEE